MGVLQSNQKSCPADLIQKFQEQSEPLTKVMYTISFLVQKKISKSSQCSFNKTHICNKCCSFMRHIENLNGFTENSIEIGFYVAPNIDSVQYIIDNGFLESDQFYESLEDAMNHKNNPYSVIIIVAIIKSRHILYTNSNTTKIIINNSSDESYFCPFGTIFTIEDIHYTQSCCHYKSSVQIYLEAYYFGSDQTKIMYQPYILDKFHCVTKASESFSYLLEKTISRNAKRIQQKYRS